jgi:hypothetical protein
MALITEIIPEQNFETVSKRIAAILLTELTNQITIQALTWDLGVFLERTTPFDKSEDIICNVSCNSINENSSTTSQSMYGNQFFIDFTTRGFQSATQFSENNSDLKLKKIAGMSRYILTNIKYKTLSFTPGFIGGVYVDSIDFEDNFGNQDGAAVKACRLTLSVRINENQSMDSPLSFDGNDTEIKLNNTKKGQQLTFNT